MAALKKQKLVRVAKSSPAWGKASKKQKKASPGVPGPECSLTMIISGGPELQHTVQGGFTVWDNYDQKLLKLFLQGVNAQDLHPGAFYMVQISQGCIVAMKRIKQPTSLWIPEPTEAQLTSSPKQNGLVFCALVTGFLPKTRVKSKRDPAVSFDHREIMVAFTNNTNDLRRRTLSVWGQQSNVEPVVGEAIILVNASTDEYRGESRLAINERGGIAFLKADTVQSKHLKDWYNNIIRPMEVDMGELPKDIEAYESEEEE